MIVRVFQHSDGNILSLPVCRQGFNGFHQFVFADVVIDKNKIWIEAHESLKNASQVKRDFSDDPLAANLLKLFKDTTHFDGIVADQENVDGLQCLSILKICFHKPTNELNTVLTKKVTLQDLFHVLIF